MILKSMINISPGFPKSSRSQLSQVKMLLALIISSKALLTTPIVEGEEAWPKGEVDVAEGGGGGKNEEPSMELFLLAEKLKWFRIG